MKLRNEANCLRSRLGQCVQELTVRRVAHDFAPSLTMRCDTVAPGLYAPELGRNDGPGQVRANHCCGRVGFNALNTIRPTLSVIKAREGVKVSSGEAGVEFLPADELQRLRRP